MLLDKRLAAFRPDLADATLEGKVEAETFVAGRPMQFCSPISSVHRAPSSDAMQLTQALFGETCLVFENRNGWAWVQLDEDGYVGYVKSDHLQSTVYDSSHFVSAQVRRRWHVFFFCSHEVRLLGICGATFGNGMISGRM